jgi:hypothetical protein
MPALYLLHTKPRLVLAFTAVLALFPACSVNVKKGSNGEDKKVDIETPVGDIHVSNGADVRDTGLAVYPGARVKQKEEDGNEKSANVDISTGYFGLKVIAVEYESDDAADKIITFYRAQLKKYGDVLECHTHKQRGNVEVNHSDQDSSSKLTCEENDGPTVELKVGTKDNQRIVAVSTEKAGSSFALVRLKMHGNDKDTI